MSKEYYYAPNEMYEVYLWFNYNIDLDDEYPCENIELIDGRIVKKKILTTFYLILLVLF
ncbi:MAG: hypothetical protein HXN59_03505 [Prevotella pallens]|nr:hypothetical protein [Prevotella pallens]